MNRILIFLLFFGTIYFQSANARDINPKKLQLSTKSDRYELLEPYSSNTNVFATSVSYVLIPGIYVRLYEAPDGFYLVGAENSLEVRTSSPRRNQEPLRGVIPRRGAIFLPTDPTQGATLLFFLPESTTSQPSTETAIRIANHGSLISPVVSGIGAGLGSGIVSAIIANRAGKMTIPKGVHPDVQLSKMLVFRNDP